jgi:hypothetical protein
MPVPTHMSMVGKTPNKTVTSSTTKTTNK